MRFRSTDSRYDVVRVQNRDLCQFNDWRMRMTSYADLMDPQVLWRKLKIPLIEKDYGNSAAEVLVTCSLVAQYADEHTPEQVKDFQKEVEINPQVWSRLIALHKDKRLKAHVKQLPASYTALYAISRMKDEEIGAAIMQGIIHPSASSHAILAWTKQHRQTSGEAVPPWRCLVVFDKEIRQEDFKAMLARVNTVASEYGAKLVGESDYVPESPEAENKRKLVGDIEQKIRQLALPVYEAMTEVKRSYSGISVVDDFLYIDLLSFAYVTRQENKKSEGKSRTTYGTLYVYRVILEFLRTDSRSQRFNYKRRLRQLAESQPELADFIDSAIKTYMTK